MTTTTRRRRRRRQRVTRVWRTPLPGAAQRSRATQQCGAVTVSVGLCLCMCQCPPYECGFGMIGTIVKCTCLCVPAHGPKHAGTQRACSQSIVFVSASTEKCAAHRNATSAHEAHACVCVCDNMRLFCLTGGGARGVRLRARFANGRTLYLGRVAQFWFGAFALV